MELEGKATKHEAPLQNTASSNGWVSLSNSSQLAHRGQGRNQGDRRLLKA